MSYQRIAVRRLAGGCGAEIDGPDLKKPLDEQTVAEIRKALIENCCVFFRGQEGMTDLDHARFAGYFGTFGRDPFVEGEETHPSVLKVAKEADEGKNPTFGGNWHSDWSFLETPPAFTFLHARELPPYGGDTFWTNLVAAYQGLSPTMRAFIDTLRAVHANVARANPKPRQHYNERIKRRPLASEHPPAAIHAETGQRVLFARPSCNLSLIPLSGPTSLGPTP